MTDPQQQFADAATSLADSFSRLATVAETFARNLFPPPPMPGAVAIRHTGEQLRASEDEMDLIKFVVQVPEEATADVVRRDVQVIFADSTTDADQVPGRAAAESKEFKGPQDSTVTVRVENVDDAGNVSASREQQFTLADTFAPPQPGEIGLRATGEEAGVE